MELTKTAVRSFDIPLSSGTGLTGHRPENTPERVPSTVCSSLPTRSRVTVAYSFPSSVNRLACSSLLLAYSRTQAVRPLNSSLAQPFCVVHL